MRVYKFIIYVPVIITFSLFTFLFCFYVLCYLYPTFKGDFESTIGIKDYWANNDDMENDRYYAQIYACIFVFCALNLFAAIVLTIFTHPGRIPEECEWDMIDDNRITPGKFKRFAHEELTNEEFHDDMVDPKYPNHFYYRFIRSSAGPLLSREIEEDKRKMVKKVQKLGENQVKSFERKKQGGIRMCQRCLRTKPDRTHHCSQCN